MNAAEYEVSMATSSEEEDDEELCKVPGTFQSLNRSGFARSTLTMQSVSTQTNHEYIAKPKLRKNLKVCTDETKATCANLSSMCGISVETSRRAVQIVCKHLYNHEFHLSNPKGVDDDSANNATQDHEPPTKKPRLPSTAAEYEGYLIVIPSARTISDYKQMQASNVELDASMHLLNKSSTTKCTLHYDTTSRSKIDGERPAILLNFSDGYQFVLRPLYFAYEDRKQIVDLLIESLPRLANAASIETKCQITVNALWEKIESFMTDAVAKNLKVTEYIAVKIQSN